MKRKLLLSFITSLMCLSFTSCNNVDAQSVKGVKVNENQWTSAFEIFYKDDEVYTINYKLESYGDIKCEYLDLKGRGVSTNEIKAIKNGTLEYVKKNYNVKLYDDMDIIVEMFDFGPEFANEHDETEEEYASFENGMYTIYSQDENNEWSTSSRLNSIIPLTFIGDISKSYYSYEYNSNLHGYIYKDSYNEFFNNHVGDTYILKFNNDGKISAIYYNYEKTFKAGNNYITSGATINLTIKYKANKITLPKIK